MMSQCIKHQQRQEQVEAAAAEANTSSHLNNNHPCNGHLFPVSSKYEIAQLTWVNAQPAMHGHGVGGLIPTKRTWGRPNGTLESIVHQATITCHNNNINKEITLNLHHHDQNSPLSNMVASSGGKCSGRVPDLPGLLTKLKRADSDQPGRDFSSVQEEREDRSACASATFCRDNDTTMMTWASYESPQSLKTKTNDEDPHSSRKTRAAAIHNQSERRRRDRINQKLKALQRLVPNASKTDKASMLDEVIDYLKQLQAQVQMMNNVRNNMHQMNMMMPLEMQQQLQLSMLARMGMGVGLGIGVGSMFDINSMAAAADRSAPQSFPPLIHPTAPVSPFIVPPMFATCRPAQANSNPGDTNNASLVPLSDPYCAFLSQSMNVELYNKMAVLFRQQLNQSTQKATSSPSTPDNHMRRD